MIIPSEKGALANFLQYIVDNCTASQEDRKSLYEKRRRYYLYGQNKMQMVRFNRLKSHLPLLASFLYSSDQIAYSVAAPKNADDRTIESYLAIEDDFNQEFQDSGLASAYDQALLWALIYDTFILKVGWNDVTDSLFAQLVEPTSFGVMREDLWSFTAQQAMTHSYLLDYDDAVERLKRAGKVQEIDNIEMMAGGSSDLGLPGTLNQMVISATGGANIMGNISGAVNPDYESSPSYTARVDAALVRLHEVWVWDSAAKDWRTFVCTGTVILSDSKDTIGAIKREAGGERKRKRLSYGSETNLFLPGENPFVPITPYPIYNFFWGDGHIEDLIPLQTWSTERLDQISEILEKQVDPAKLFSGFMGIDDERAAALGAPGTWMADQLPGAKVEELKPTMPEDLFREFAEIGALFMEQSGFTEIMAGKGEKNVRGKSHAQALKTTGGGRVRKVASHLEESLVRLGDIALRLKAYNDDEILKSATGFEFVTAQVLEDSKYTMRVAGHSHSPLFTAETQEIAALLFKAQAVDQQWLVRLLRPPMMDNLLHALKQRQAAQAKKQQDMLKAGIDPNHPPKRNGHAPRPNA